ncbi:DUF1801 domain-containing protein [Pseudoalteromonas sp. GB56]
MSELKTRPNDADVITFLETIEHPVRKADALVLLDLFIKVTGREAVMWGDSIIGFGRYSYSNSKGEYTWLMTGFSPRKSNLSLYIMQGFEHFNEEVAALGKTKHAKSCLYINKLSDIDLDKLESLLRNVVADMHKRYKCE